MARIKIDLDRRLGRMDRNIYGNFAEHLGRCIYGGIYEEGSPLSDERGFRTDVVEAVRGLITGTHVITLTATDSDGQMDSAIVNDRCRDFPDLPAPHPARPLRATRRWGSRSLLQCLLPTAEKA